MTRTILTITQAILVCTVIAVHADPIPAGLLGFPLGTYLTIEGVRPDDGMKVNPTCTLVVDVVNSNKLDEPVLIAVENLAGRYFPTNSRIVIRGYESGEMIGVPDEVAQAERLSVPQVPWQFYRYFVLTSCVEPKEFPTHDMESGAERRAQRRKLTTRNSQPADTIEFETTTQQLDVVRSGRLAEFILQHPKIPPAIIDGSAEVPQFEDIEQFYFDVGDSTNNPCQIIVTYTPGVEIPTERGRKIELTGTISEFSFKGSKVGTKSEYRNEVLSLKSWKYLGE